MTTSQARSANPPAPRRRSNRAATLWKTSTLLILSLVALQLSAREKDTTDYGAGLIVNLPFPETEVAQVVQDVIQNGLIRGTKEYNKDEYISGATQATSTKVFKEWTEGGNVFYKVRLKALDPRNFKNSSDLGTLAVRYIVQPQGDKNTVLRIDAVFVEDFRKISHPSNGSVESAEYKDIHDRLDAIESMKAQTVEVEKEKQEQLARKQQPAPIQDSSHEPPPADASLANPPAEASHSNAEGAASAPAAKNNETDAPANAATVPAAQTLEERVRDLRHQLERLVKAPGAPLKSAPFHTASTLQSLPAGTEVMIVISTTYWFGVETHDGQHGWMLRDQLEPAP